MVRTTSQFPKADVKNIALKVLENNAYFTHPEMVTLAMLGDEGDTVRNQAVSNILQFRQHATQTRNTNNQRKKANETTYYRDKSVTKFVILPINSNTLCYQELLNVALSDEPPATKNLSENKLHNIRNQPFIFKQPCHNQVVEHHLKLVSEASSKVIGFQKKDGLIRKK